MKFGVKLARLDNRVRRRIDVCTISTSFEYRDVAGYLHVPVFFCFFFIDILFWLRLYQKTLGDLFVCTIYRRFKSL